MREILRKRQETRTVTGVELFDVVFDIVYHSVLTWVSLQSMVF